MVRHQEAHTVPPDLAPSAGSTEGTAGQSSRLERQTYTVEEAAQILGISRTLAYRKGVLPTVRIAGRLVPSRRLNGCSRKQRSHKGAAKWAAVELEIRECPIGPGPQAVVKGGRCHATVTISAG